MNARQRIEISTDDFLIELLMVLVDRLEGEAYISEEDLERVVDGRNELAMQVTANGEAVYLKVQREF